MSLIQSVQIRPLAESGLPCRNDSPALSVRPPTLPPLKKTAAAFAFQGVVASGLRAMLPWQPAVVERVCGSHRAGLLLDKRLGKSVVAVRWVLTLPIIGPEVLIVAPLSAIPDWLSNLEADGQCGLIYNGSEIGPKTIVNPHLLERKCYPVFHITNWEGTFKPARGAKYPEFKGAATRSWDVVILDETVKIKNPKSQINQIIHKAFGDAPYKAILSGEPAPQSHLDYFEQLKWLAGGRFMNNTNWWKFRDEYFDQVGYEWVPKKGSIAKIKEAIHERCVVLKREDVGMSNVRTFEKLYCELPSSLKKSYDEIEDNMEFNGREYNSTLPIQIHLARIAGGYHPDLKPSGHKMDVLVEALDRDYRNDKVVIVFNYNAELNEAYRVLTKEKFKCEWIQGGVSVPERRLRADRFQHGRSNVMLAQLKVAKYGIDWSAADVMIQYSMSYDYDDISQSMDRIMHPTKQRPIHYVRVITTDTNDEDKVEAYYENRANTRTMLTTAVKLQEQRIALRRVFSGGK